METIKTHRLQSGIHIPGIEVPPKKKRRVLWLSDFCCATGFAQVAHNVLRELHKTGLYEFDVLGINYPGGHIDASKYPIADDIRIYPAWPQGCNDVFGRELLLLTLANRNVDIRGPWDFLFTLNDPFILEPIARNIKQLQAGCKKGMPKDWQFKWISYWPIDAPSKENWITKSVAQSDYPVAYCQYGYEQMMRWDQPGGIYEWSQQPGAEEKVKGNLLAPSLKGRIRIIRHGTNLKDFYPFPKEERLKFRKEFFQDKIKPNDFLIANISRNQPRKDLARTLAIFAHFQKKVPSSFLYLHARVDDVGGNLQEIARHFDLDQNKWGFPAGFNEGRGYPTDFVNKMYNAADVCLTTTLGEGWGLISTEAMAAKTPIAGPNITSFREIFNTDAGFDPETARGIPIAAGSTSSEFICFGQTDNERVRPLTNVDDAVSKLYWVYKNPEKVQAIVERAYEWVKTVTWEKECQKWVALFEEAYQQLEMERNLPEQKGKDKIGRNDPCPICLEKGIQKKWKKCKEHNAKAI
jgi:glycosyltransferase involved in cell wall biosynthesis